MEVRLRLSVLTENMYPVWNDLLRGLCVLAGFMILGVFAEYNSAENISAGNVYMSENLYCTGKSMRMEASGKEICGAVKMTENIRKAKSSAAEIMSESLDMPDTFGCIWIEREMEEERMPETALPEEVVFAEASPFKDCEAEKEAAAGPVVISGFLVNEAGHITAYADEPPEVVDGLFCMPAEEGCTGIERGALDVIKDEIAEIYIPNNITYIAPGAFDNLNYLLFIQVAEDNPVYYSVDGALYSYDGTMTIYPAGRLNW